MISRPCSRFPRCTCWLLPPAQLHPAFHHGRAAGDAGQTSAAMASVWSGTIGLVLSRRFGSGQVLVYLGLTCLGSTLPLLSRRLCCASSTQWPVKHLPGNGRLPSLAVSCHRHHPACSLSYCTSHSWTAPRYRLCSYLAIFGRPPLATATLPASGHRC